jgi:hypothetical protein
MASLRAFRFIEGCIPLHQDHVVVYRKLDDCVLSCQMSLSFARYRAAGVNLDICPMVEFSFAL